MTTTAINNGPVKTLGNSDRALIGVIGGLGTLATIDFFKRVADLTPAECEQQHVPLMIYNASQTPDRNRSILTGDSRCGEMLADAARKLEKADCDYLVMPCNAAHYYVEMIRAAVEIPFVSMIDITCAQVAKSAVPGSKIGVICSDGTRHARLYESALADVGLASVVLSDTEQRRCMECIYDVKTGRVTDKTRERIRALLIKLAEKGANQVIAACTEIPILLSSNDVAIPVVNASDLLALECIKLSTSAQPQLISSVVAKLGTPTESSSKSTGERNHVR